MRRLLALGATVVTLSGCAVGPKYSRPAVPAPDRFYGTRAPAEEGSLADRPWWELFSDPVLRSLVDEALRSSHDLQIAVSRVEEARGRYGVAGSYWYPAVSYSASASRSKTSTYASPSDVTGSLIAANATISWELDLWGRIRHLNEAARAQVLASEEARSAVALTLVADVASAYFDLRELDEELEIARHTRGAFQDTFDLFSRRLEGGAGSALETSRAESLLANASAQIPLVERRIVAKENQIALLLGRTPGPIARGVGLNDQPLPPAVPAGLPATLLLRRPDLRRAEQDLIAANANVGVAHASLFPTLSLTGVFGGQSTQLSDLLTAGKAWSIGAGILGPLFQGGKLRAEERVARAQFEEARLAYERAVTQALGEVSTSLVAIQKLAEEVAQRARAVSATREAVRLATLRYESGFSAYFEVLDALQQVLVAETVLAQTRRDRLVALTSFYKALGGGWQAPPSASPASIR
jgi:multidrug efflux system outer membrane protein